MKLQALENGIWHGSFEDAAGNLRVISLRTSDRKTAETFAAALVELSATDAGSEAPKLGEVVRDWLREKETEVAPATFDFYRQTTKDFLQFLGSRAEDDIKTIVRADVINYRSGICRRLSAKTTNHRLKTLRMFFAWAVAQRFLWESPAGSVKAIRNDEPRMRRPFALCELRKVLDIADPEWRTLIKLGLYTGQRLGDLARLNWRNVDLEKETIELVTRKTRKRLVIPLAPTLVEHLRGVKRPDAIADMPIVPEAFKSVQRCHGRVTTLCNQFGALLAKCGLREPILHTETGRGRSIRRFAKELSFHSLRHTAVSLLKEAGASQSVANGIYWT